MRAVFFISFMLNGLACTAQNDCWIYNKAIDSLYNRLSMVSIDKLNTKIDPIETVIQTKREFGNIPFEVSIRKKLLEFTANDVEIWFADLIEEKSVITNFYSKSFDSCLNCKINLKIPFTCIEKDKSINDKIKAGSNYIFMPSNILYEKNKNTALLYIQVYYRSNHSNWAFLFKRENSKSGSWYIKKMNGMPY
jgi:hypothetical protein